MSDKQVRSIATDTTELGRIHSSRLSDAQSQMVFALMRLQDPRVDFILREFNATIIVGPRVGLEYGDYTPQVKVRELAECKARIAKEQAKAEREFKRSMKKQGRKVISMPIEIKGKRK